MTIGTEISDTITEITFKIMTKKTIKVEVKEQINKSNYNSSKKSQNYCNYN